MVLQVLIQDYLGCRANKRRSMDSVHFELHWERDLVRLLEDINDRNLVPLLYCFVKLTPRPREVNACLMPTKIIQYHFDRRVRPLVEAELTDRTFNNRVGFGPDTAINRLLQDIFEVSEGYTRDCWVVSRDIQAFFPSARLADSYDQYRALIERNVPEGEQRDDLLYFLLRTVYAYPQRNSRRRSPLWMWQAHIRREKSVIFSTDYGRGAALGEQYWQVAQNYALNGFDHAQVQSGFRYLRYVDDMCWVGADKALLLAHVKQAEQELAKYGYTMHPRKRNCQHFTKGGSFIGFHFKPGRVYVSHRVVNRAKERIRWWNRRASLKNLHPFLSSLNSSLGRIKRTTNYGIVRDLVELVSPKWWRWCHYDDSRRCLVANPGYGINDMLMKTYHFTYKKKKNGNTRPNQRP